MSAPPTVITKLQGCLTAAPCSTVSFASLHDAASAGRCVLYPEDGPTHITVSAFIQHSTTGAFAAMWHPKAHCWRQPGGHLDPTDATILAAAQREVAEEIGIHNITWSHSFWLRTFDIPNSERCSQHIDFAIGGRTTTTLTSPEGHRVRWQSAAEGEHVNSWTAADIASFHQTMTND